MERALFKVLPCRAKTKSVLLDPRTSRSPLVSDIVVSASDWRCRRERIIDRLINCPSEPRRRKDYAEGEETYGNRERERSACVEEIGEKAIRDTENRWVDEKVSTFFSIRNKQNSPELFAG